VRRRDVELELRDEPAEARHLTFRDAVQHQAGERRRVDDRVLQGALEAAAHEPGVEGVMAVLDQHRSMRESQESAPRVLEHRRPDEHRAVDVVALARVWVDGRAAIDEGVEKRQRAVEPETLGAQLEDQEGSVPGRLDVERHELGLVERGRRPHLGRIDRNLLPGHQRGRAAWFQEEWLGARVGAHRALENARRAKAISSLFTARMRKQATA
jgi:hypothetical protein